MDGGVIHLYHDISQTLLPPRDGVIVHRVAGPRFVYPPSSVTGDWARSARGPPPMMLLRRWVCGFLLTESIGNVLTGAWGPGDGKRGRRDLEKGEGGVPGPASRRPLLDPAAVGMQQPRRGQRQKGQRDGPWLGSDVDGGGAGSDAGKSAAYGRVATAVSCCGWY